MHNRDRRISINRAHEDAHMAKDYIRKAEECFTRRCDAKRQTSWADHPPDYEMMLLAQGLGRLADAVYDLVGERDACLPDYGRHDEKLPRQPFLCWLRHAIWKWRLGRDIARMDREEQE